jgi:hypothetical protein
LAGFEYKKTRVPGGFMAARYGSDLIVDLMKVLGIEAVALNPGSSFRGLHDSLVNYESGTKPNPEMILCCHEEIAVAVARGYFKATGKIMPPLSIMSSACSMHRWRSTTPGATTRR